MTQPVVVAVEGELSEHDASAAVAHHTADGPPDYHLLIAARQRTDGPGGLAMLGLHSGDIMSRSAGNLRSASGGNVTVSITHADMLAGTRGLVEATGSKEVVIVVGPGRYPQFAMPEWRQKLSSYLMGAQVRAVQHTRDFESS